MVQASSLRTTVALSALALISDLAVALPPSPASEHLLDAFLAHCLSVAGQTKKLVAAGSQATVTTLLEHPHSPTVPLRTVQLVVALLNEKTPAARQFGAQHVLTLLRRVESTSPRSSSSSSSSFKSALDSNAATAALEAAIKKGLQDANPQVRETSRVAFWEFEQHWPDKALAIAAGLDPGGRKLLDKARPAAAAPVNSAAPDGPAASSSSPLLRAPVYPQEAEPDSPTTSPLRTRAVGNPAGKKPSVREAMMAARKKMLAEKEHDARGLRSDADPDGAVTLPSSPPPALSGMSASPARDAELAPAELETPTRVRPTPFAASTESPLQGNDSAAFSAAATSTSSSPNHVPESIVDDALRDQARQAELAAERLLELSIDEHESRHAIPPLAETADVTSMTPRSERRSSRIPRTATASTANLTPGGFSTPLPNPALRRFTHAGVGAAVFEDSPDPRDVTGAAAGRGRWWARDGAFPAAAEAGPVAGVVVTDGQRAELARLVAELCRGEGVAEGPGVFRKLSELSRQVPMRASAADSAGEDSFARLEDPASLTHTEQEQEEWTGASFWREDRAFDKAYDRLKVSLLRSEADLVSPELGSKPSVARTASSRLGLRSCCHRPVPRGTRLSGSCATSSRTSSLASLARRRICSSSS